MPFLFDLNFFLQSLMAESCV